MWAKALQTFNARQHIAVGDKTWHWLSHARARARTAAPEVEEKQRPPHRAHCQREREEEPSRARLFELSRLKVMRPHDLRWIRNDRLR